MKTRGICETKHAVDKVPKMFQGAISLAGCGVPTPMRSGQSGSMMSSPTKPESDAPQKMIATPTSSSPLRFGASSPQLFAAAGSPDETYRWRLDPALMTPTGGPTPRSDASSVGASLGRVRYRSADGGLSSDPIEESPDSLNADTPVGNDSLPGRRTWGLRRSDTPVAETVELAVRRNPQVCSLADTPVGNATVADTTLLRQDPQGGLLIAEATDAGQITNIYERFNAGHGCEGEAAKATGNESVKAQKGPKAAKQKSTSAKAAKATGNKSVKAQKGLKAAKAAKATKSTGNESVKVHCRKKMILPVKRGPLDFSESVKLDPPSAKGRRAEVRAPVIRSAPKATPAEDRGVIKPTDGFWNPDTLTYGTWVQNSYGCKVFHPYDCEICLSVGGLDCELTYMRACLPPEGQEVLGDDEARSGLLREELLQEELREAQGRSTGRSAPEAASQAEAGEGPPSSARVGGRGGRR